MRIYSIKKRLNIPEYKITDILLGTDKEIHIKIGPTKGKDLSVQGAVKFTKLGSMD